MITKEANIVWHGAGKTGKGEITTQSKVVNAAPYGFGARFENGPGTNPEELIAAAHSACFTMAIAFALSEAGFEPKELTTNAKVLMDKEGTGWGIKEVKLSLNATVPEINDKKFQEIAATAKANCPVSKVLNAKISLEAKLLS